MTTAREERTQRHGPPLDDFFDAMSDRDRRYVLYYFRESDDDVATVDELCIGILAHERDSDSESESESERTDRETVETRLHHVALPKLEDCGFLEYDSRSGTVRYRDDHRYGDCIDHSAWTEFRAP